MHDISDLISKVFNGINTCDLDDGSNLTPIDDTKNKYNLLKTKEDAIKKFGLPSLINTTEDGVLSNSKKEDKFLEKKIFKFKERCEFIVNGKIKVVYLDILNNVMEIF